MTPLIETETSLSRGRVELTSGRKLTTLPRSVKLLRCRSQEEPHLE